MKSAAGLVESYANNTKDRPMHVCIHRGSAQIGGSCVEVEHEGPRLLLDLVLPLDAPDNTPALLPAGLALAGVHSP